MKNKLNIIKRFTYILLINILVNSFASCSAKRAIYIYGTPEFAAKEKELKYSVKEAAMYCQNYLAAHGQLDTPSYIRLDLLYGDEYIFQIKPMRHNPKTTIYMSSGIWVNGKNGIVKEVKAPKPLKVYLEPLKFKSFFKLMNTKNLNN